MVKENEMLRKQNWGKAEIMKGSLKGKPDWWNKIDIVKKKNWYEQTGINE